MAIENELPHWTADAAHALEAARLTIRAQARQLAEAEDHNRELLAVLAQVRVQVQATDRAAINRLAQGSPDPRYWQGQQDAARAVWALVKPVV